MSRGRLTALLLALLWLKPAQAEDIAWVWDHQSAPAQTRHFAVTVSHIELDGVKVRVRPRFRALATGTARVTPVVHVQPMGRQTPALNAAQAERIIGAVLAAGGRSSSGWVQLDLEARTSQRESYRALVKALRAQLPPALKLSVTALAWQCRSAAWLDGLAADEVVPMFFGMGRDGPALLALVRDAPERLHARCRSGAAGFAVEETPRAAWMDRYVRRYWFHLRGASTVPRPAPLDLTPP